MALTKEVVIYDKVLKIENEKLQKEIDKIKAKKKALCMWTKAGGCKKFCLVRLPFGSSRRGLLRGF